MIYFLTRTLCLLLISNTIYGSNLLEKPVNEVQLVNHLPENYVTDASVDYTEIVQNVLYSHSVVCFPNFPILINEKGLYLTSDSILRNANLVLKPNDQTHYAMIHIVDIDNVQLSNFKLKGDRDKHLGDKGEWGMGIYIKHASNILIKDSEIKELWGDGIDITKRKGKTPTNIKIINSVFKRNRRNGITISSGHKIVIENCSFFDTDGTLPMAGIDIEPNNNTDELGEILIKNIVTSNNSKGVQISLRGYPSKEEREINISIDGLESSNDDYGVRVTDLYRKKKYGDEVLPLKGKILIENITISNPKIDFFKYFRPKGYNYAPKVIFKNIKISSKTIPINVDKLKLDMEKRGFDVREF